MENHPNPNSNSNSNPNATTTDAIFMSYRIPLPETSWSVVRIDAIYENTEQESYDDGSMVFRNCVFHSGETEIDTYITVDHIGYSRGGNSNSNSNNNNISVYRGSWISVSASILYRYVWERKCSTKVWNRSVAIKAVENPESVLILQQEIRRSMGVQGNHKNLLWMKAHFVDEQSGKLCVVMPYPGCSLRTVMEFAFPGGFPEDLILSALRPVLKALRFLHRQNILHRDINAGHVYLSEPYKLIYQDPVSFESNYEINLGFAATVYEDEEEDIENGPYLPMASMSNWAAAPEIYNNENQLYTEKADIWFVGITALELSYGELDLPNRNALEDMIKEIHDKKKLTSKKNNYSKQGNNTFKTTFKYYIKKLLPLFSPSSRGDKLVPPCSSSSYDEELMLPLLSSNDVDDDEDYCPFSGTFTKMVMKCLAWDPEERPSVDELLSHKFFRKNWRRLDGCYLYDAVKKQWPSLS